MKLVFDIFMTLVFCFWPMMMMFSPMMFDAPGSEKNTKAIAIICLVMMYPIFIALALFAFDIRYYDFAPTTLLTASMVIVLGGFTLFGYTKMLWNLINGIPISGYAVVRDKVYFSGSNISNADPHSFRLLAQHVDDANAEPRYAVDQRHVYYLGQVIEGFKPQHAKLTLIDERLYLVNDTQIADGGQLIMNASPQTYRTYEPYSTWSYSTEGDNSTVYYHCQPVADIDYASFTPLTHELGKDNNALFYRGKRLQLCVDLASFKLLQDDCYFADKAHFYCLIRSGLVSLDNEHINDIELLDYHYIKGKHAIYYYQYDSLVVVENADVATFEVIDYDAKTRSHAKDKHHYFSRGKVVE
ncbi:DKNYY domain-containing protein [Shewanella sp.]|uniref:DKNYY domain-containing protein n=1 Tax=Shewanella sp. TaxID=50422 RepID=UPI003A980D4D